MTDQNTTGQREKSISLLDILTTLVKHRKFIVLFTFAGAMLVLLYAVSGKIFPPGSPFNLTPDYYTVRMSIQLDEASGKTTLPASSSSSNAIIAMMPGQAPQLSSNLLLLKELLYSNYVLDAIIEKNNLIAIMGAEIPGNPLPTLRAFVKNSLKLEFSPNVGSQVFYLFTTTGDPTFAVQFMKSVIPVLEERFKSLTLDRVRRKKRFIEDQMEKINSDIEIAKNNLLDFQRKYGSIDIEAQAKEQTNLIARMQSDIITNELEAQTMREYLPRDDPKIVRLQNENRKKEELIEDLKSGFKDNSDVGFIPQNSIPAISLEFKALQKEVDVVEDIYSLLRQEYERVKIEETDNTKLFQVIQQPEIPEQKSGPSRTKMCIIFTTTAFALAILLSFIIEYFKTQRLDPEEKEKLENIKRILKRKKSNQQA